MFQIIQSNVPSFAVYFCTEDHLLVEPVLAWLARPRGDKGEFAELMPFTGGNEYGVTAPDFVDGDAHTSPEVLVILDRVYADGQVTTTLKSVPRSAREAEVLLREHPEFRELRRAWDEAAAKKS